MISLARTDGARKDILELCTHTPRKSGNTIDLYTTFPWEALCVQFFGIRFGLCARPGEIARRFHACFSRSPALPPCRAFNSKRGM